MWRIYISIFAMLLLAQPAAAEVENNYWESIQRDQFAGKQVLPGEFIKLTAPQRAESGAQVPFAFSVDYPVKAGQYVKTVTVVADANPVPVVAVFHFTPQSGKAEISTRIRLEVDSLVHVVAETSDGKLYVNAIAIRATGGCGGTVGGDEEEAKRNAGKMKLVIDDGAGEGDLRYAKLLIKHPMFTGLQRDLESQGYRPAFFINKIDIRFNDEPVLLADTYIGVSEDPSIRFPFIAKGGGTLRVTILDNEDNEFSQSLEISPDT